MYGFEIILIVVGLLVVVISFLLTDKGAQNTKYAVDEKVIEKELEKINGKVDSIIEARREEIIETTDDKLSYASNEKIMEFKEYTDQVIEKIDRNHQEVVFLYDMLDKKNNELKESLKRFNDSKAQLEIMLTETERFVSGNTSGNNKAVKKTEDTKKAVSKENNIENPAQQLMTDANDSFSKGIKNIPEKETQKKDRTTKKTKAENAKVVAKSSAKQVNSESDKQDKILYLHKQGKSVIEISKMLGMGQGEVKLIINLYKGE